MKKTDRKGRVPHCAIYMKDPEQTNPARQKVDERSSEAEKRREQKMTANGHGVSFGADDNSSGMTKLERGGGCANLVRILKTTESYVFKG